MNIGSLMCLSGYMPPLNGEEKVVRNTKIFSYHGKEDGVVPEKVHREGVDNLKKLGHSITYEAEKYL